MCVLHKCADLMQCPTCVSAFTMQRRAQCVGQVLLGYLEVPAALDQQLSFVVNPPSQARHDERVWNAGDQRTKLVSWPHMHH